MKDYIVSYSRNERYAEIEYESSPEFDYYFRGKILGDTFPPRLRWLLQEHGELVREVVLTLLDDVEEEISKYDLRLEISGERIFDLELKGGELTFFTRYGVSGGYLEQYPWGEAGGSA
ncbi:hypothetical protein [Saccharibacillus kuerlensis]|uniref:Uncharacterized protein n=1 Tax=Saccharibacillus kuerlensis TaxID=459527 RepID=A0ABQ2L646_9BACL|nr:hypothetical protein [Saccharibacillus kuerlensis]GGO01228.1 hypothetical protein GCM10010969_23300 [Saccharibacillus kuerlensis]